MRGQVRFSRFDNRGTSTRRGKGARDLLSLLRPAGAFDYPHQVVEDPDLTLNEKRAILSSWASDACVSDGTPVLRQAPREGLPVEFDDIMDALRELDEQAAHDNRPRPHYRRVLSRRRRSSGRSLG
jgi:hypothetical protein